jgi:hypothetical protein
MPNLEFIFFSKNSFTGRLPSPPSLESGLLPQSNINYILFDHNKFTGIFHRIY